MNNRQSRIIMHALDNEDDLKPADWDFVNDLADDENNRPLTPRQSKWLNDIAERTGYEEE